jgi:hypothetical protein
MITNVIEMEAPSLGVETNERILRRVLTALNEGRVSDAIDQFDSYFTFNDHALDLEFTDKVRLTEFFQRSRELFADSHVEVESISECGDHAIAKWKLTGTQNQDCGGYASRRVRISLQGVSIAYLENARIVKWSDFYDAMKSWRLGLADLFREWTEY